MSSYLSPILECGSRSGREDGNEGEAVEDQQGAEDGEHMQTGS